MSRYAGLKRSYGVRPKGGSMGEASPAWRKSSFSQDGDCAEWLESRGLIYIRNSNNPSGPILTFTHSEWQAFINGVKAGEADLALQED